MGGMFKTKIPKQDTTALKAAEEQRKKSKQEAEAAQMKQAAADEANRLRRKNVTTSGRDSTILAGENPNSLLGG